LDAAEFETSTAAGLARLAPADPADPAGAAEHLRAAIGLWQGNVFADLGDFDFIRTYADRLNNLLVYAQEGTVDAELALGHHTAVVDAMAPLIAAHPLRERFHAQRTLALYRCGRQADALSGYTALRQLLVDELGIEPNQHIQALHRQILERSTELDWHPSAPLSEASVPRSNATVVAAAPGPAPKRRRRSGRSRLLAAAAFVLAAGTVAAVTWHNQPSSARLAAVNSAVEIGTNGRVRASVPVGQPPGGVAATSTPV
jgi:DNA-binding SARP family transcriptional activator